MGTSEPLETAKRTEQEHKLMQGRDTVQISDDRVKSGVQQSFLGQATVPAKPPWQVPVIPVSPAAMQRGNHMLMNQSPVVTPMTHRYLYPQFTVSVSSGDGASTRVVTFNIENFYTNKLYLSSLMKQSHIIATQEHWLYSYEKRNMSDFCAEQGFSVVLKSVDDDDPLLPTCRPRGKGV